MSPWHPSPWYLSFIMHWQLAFSPEITPCLWLLCPAVEVSLPRLECSFWSPCQSQASINARLPGTPHPRFPWPFPSTSCAAPKSAFEHQADILPFTAGPALSIVQVLSVNGWKLLDSHGKKQGHNREAILVSEHLTSGQDSSSHWLQ